METGKDACSVTKAEAPETGKRLTGAHDEGWGHAYRTLSGERVAK